MKIQFKIVLNSLIFSDGRIHPVLSLLLIAGTETIVQPSVMFLLSVFSRPPWFDLPPPPYLQDGELASEGELPQYEAPQDPVSHPAAHPYTPSTPRTVATGTRPSNCSGEESAQL